MAKFSLNPDYLAATASCIGTEETRYYLRGVFVTPHEDPETGMGVLMVATDGHRMAIFYDRDGYAERQAILSMDWKSPVLKSGSGRRVTPLRLFIEADMGTTYAHNSKKPLERLGSAVGMLPVSEIDGSFPDFWRVLPAVGDPIAIVDGFDVDYLASFGAALKRANAGTKALKVEQYADGGPAWVRSSHEDSAFIIMPVRLRDVGGQPGFLKSGWAKQR